MQRLLGEEQPPAPLSPALPTGAHGPHTAVVKLNAVRTTPRKNLFSGKLSKFPAFSFTDIVANCQ